MKSIILCLYFTTLIFITSCYNNQEKKLKTSDSISNSSSIHSTDINKLKEYLKLTPYTPDSVEFNYTFIDNSAGKDRTSISGPSDYILQAVLYYDSLTFQKIIALPQKESVSKYNVTDFKFEWLNESITQELNDSSNYLGIHPDTQLGEGNIKTWCLINKIVVEKLTN